MTTDLSQFFETFFEESTEGLDVMESTLLALPPGEADEEDIKAAIDSERDAIETTAAETEALKKDFEELDKDVAEATEQRKDEHAQYIDEAASDQAIVELLGGAKNRLNTFHNPTLYKEPEPVAEEVEFFAQRRAALGPPPEPLGEYKKASIARART